MTADSAENWLRRYLVGGVNSPVRAFRQIGGEPLLLSRAKGAHVTDAAGARRLDLIMGWGALLLGHQHPAVARAVRRAAGRGILLGLTHAAEGELARLLVEAIPSIDRVRFTVSGTEACMTAVRLARAHTGRANVLVFDGCYHGHSDSLLAARSGGIPQPILDETLIVPFNDLSAFEAAMGREGRRLACVLVEPVAANMGVVLPEPGFLQCVRDLTRRHGTLLIFDEVVTGFRACYGGVQDLYGVTPDLTVLGKIVGGGLPIGVVGGPARLMKRLAPEGEVYHGGTFAAHPLSVAAGIAALRELRARPPYRRLEALSQRLASKLLEQGDHLSVPLCVNRLGSMLTVFFSRGPVRNLTQARTSNRRQFARWARTLSRHGVLAPPSPFEAMFLSAAHTEDAVDRIARASSLALRTLRTPKRRAGAREPLRQRGLGALTARTARAHDRSPAAPALIQQT